MLFNLNSKPHLEKIGMGKVWDWITWQTSWLYRQPQPKLLLWLGLWLRFFNKYKRMTYNDINVLSLYEVDFSWWELCSEFTLCVAGESAKLWKWIHMLMSESFLGNLHCSFGILSKYNNKKYIYLKETKFIWKIRKSCQSKYENVYRQFY